MEQALYMTHEEHHRALVKQIAGDITGARRLWPVSARLALWLALEGAILVWALIHARSDLMLKLNLPVYAAEVVAFGVAAILSARLALRSAIPGRDMRPAEVVLCIALVLAGSALVAVGHSPGLNGRPGEFFRVGLPCAWATCMLAALPWLALWWAVKRGAPMRGGISGLWTGAGALLFAFAMLRLVCPIDDPLHIIAWHLLPALAVIALSAWAGSAWLGFRLRPLHRERSA